MQVLDITMWRQHEDFSVTAAAQSIVKSDIPLKNCSYPLLLFLFLSCSLWNILYFVLACPEFLQHFQINRGLSLSCVFPTLINFYRTVPWKI